MKHKTPIEERIRGWLPNETSLPSNQTISMFSHLTRFQFVQLAYGVMLVTLLIVPFGVYHSRSEPYITGYLWGYDLPIGYIGLLLGIVVILYPRLNALRSLRLSSLMPFIDLIFLISFFFTPSYYFINLLHSTNFSSFQIDVDYPLGNSAVLWLSLLSIIFGLVSVTMRHRYSEARKQLIQRAENMNPKKSLENLSEDFCASKSVTHSIITKTTAS